MQVIASLRKRTAKGVSTWTFVVDNEMKVCYAVGGEDLKVIRATDRKHLRQIYTKFQSYGYTRKLSEAKTAPKKEQYISDPWASSLPAEMQQELEVLSVA